MRASFRVLMAFCGCGLAVGSVCAQTEDASPQAQAVAAGRGLIGAAAPPFVLETIDGESIDLGALYGKKAVYLKFWATWCVPCRRQMPHFENTWQHAGDDLAVIGVNAGFNDSRDDVLRYREELKISMPLVIDDGTLAAAFNLRVTPQHIVIGRDGRIRYVGQLADERLDAELRNARAAESAVAARVGPPETRAGAVQAAEIAPAIGAPLPDLTLATVAGDTFATRPRSGDRSGTALVFFIPWCESYWQTSRPAMAETCRRVREQVEALRSTHGGVRWLGVASTIWGTERALLDYQRDYGTTLPLALDADGRWFRAFGVMTVPTVVLADAEGKIVRRIEGYDEGLAAAVAALDQGNDARDAAAPQVAGTSAEPLLGKILEDVGGRQLAVTKLVYQPGASSMPHRHQAYLAVYVVSGHVESALDDEEPVLYGPGDAWYEAHNQLHRVFRNPSSTEPFTVIVFALRDADHPAVRESDTHGP